MNGKKKWIALFEARMAITPSHNYSNLNINRLFMFKNLYPERVETWNLASKASFAIFSFLCLLAGMLNGEANESGSEKPFVIVIPSYNNAEWHKRNLDSIRSQAYNNFRAIYIDDCSTDETGHYVEEYIQSHGLEEWITLIQNENRVGALANLYHAIWLCSPDEIVINLDGDDWFSHRDVLSNLNRVYADSDVWLTYGQFIYYPSYHIGFGNEISKEIIEQNAFRSLTSGGTTHLRSYYAGLFQRIKKEDLFYQGDFCQASYDMAIMFPMLEMAGKHSRFVPDISYVYNVSNQINDHKINYGDQAAIDRYLRTQEKYIPIPHFMYAEAPKKIYITPGAWGQLFAYDNPYYNKDDGLEVMRRLHQTALKERYEVLQADDTNALENFEYLVHFEVDWRHFQNLDKYPKEKRILFLWEPPSVLPENYNPGYHRLYSRVYTWNDELVDNKKYFKFYYPVFKPMIADPIDFYKKRLCTLIGCNKQSSHPNELYSHRLKVVHFFENFPNDDFDFFGRGWPTVFKTYRGPINRKVDYLKHYKFCFCYENIKDVPGYITEKIFDCFHAGTVPIYWGASNIAQYIPKNCFLWREDFADESELYAFIKNMDEKTYQEYIRNIKRFLESEEAQLYSIDNFVKIFMDLVTAPPQLEEH
jgi:alpha(1,3/1,4) fucosyltransferase